MSAANTDPVYRAESVADAAKLDWETRLLREVVNYGVTLLQKITDCRTIGHTEGCLVVLAAQSIAMADAIEILVSAGTADAARIPARTLFEAQLYAQWVLARDTDHRALCWWAHVKRRERDDLARHIATTREGKELAQLFADAGIAGPLIREPQRQADAAARLEGLDARCSTAPWSSIKKDPRWYRPAGATNIQEVARSVNQEHLYVVFYKAFCTDVHSSNVERWLEIGAGKQQVRGLRTLRGTQMLLQFSIPLMFSLYEALIDRFIPAEKLSYECKRRAWGPCLSKVREPHYDDPPLPEGDARA